MEKKTASLRGIYRDILKDKEDNIIFDSGWENNLIVDRCRVLLAAFMKNDNAQGIQSVKIGRGLEEWDDLETGPPSPQAGDTALQDPEPYVVDVEDVDRVSLEFLDENDEHSNLPTNRVQITVTLGEDQPPAPEGSVVSSYPLREFGLFGTYDDGVTVEDYMIDCIHHQVIHKDTSATLIRKVKLYF